jgi:site-specific recombinase XerC
MPATIPDPAEALFLRHLADERQLSPNTVAAYRRDLADLAAFLTGYYGTPDWEWSHVDRMALRGFLGWGQRRGLARRPWPGNSRASAPFCTSSTPRARSR